MGCQMLPQPCTSCLKTGSLASTTIQAYKSSKTNWPGLFSRRGKTVQLLFSRWELKEICHHRILGAATQSIFLSIYCRTHHGSLLEHEAFFGRLHRKSLSNTLQTYFGSFCRNFFSEKREVCARELFTEGRRSYLWIHRTSVEGLEVMVMMMMMYIVNDGLRSFCSFVIK